MGWKGGGRNTVYQPGRHLSQMHPVNQSINRPYSYSASFKIWSAVLNNVKNISAFSFWYLSWRSILCSINTWIVGTTKLFTRKGKLYWKRRLAENVIQCKANMGRGLRPSPPPLWSLHCGIASAADVWRGAIVRTRAVRRRRRRPNVGVAPAPFSWSVHVTLYTSDMLLDFFNAVYNESSTLTKSSKNDAGVFCNSPWYSNEAQKISTACTVITAYKVAK